MTIMLLLALQDAIKLELKSAVGEKSVHTRRESNTGKILVTVAGQKVSENTLEVETRRHRDEVLEVDGPAPVRVRRTIEAWSEIKEKGAQAVKAVKTLQGKTIVLKRTADGGTAVEGAEGAPAAEVRKQRLRPEILFGAFPAQPVAVGQEWQIEEAALLKDFGETGEDDAARFTTAKGGAKLEKLEEHKGARCAVVAVSVKASGTIKGQTALKSSFDIRARVWMDVAKGRVLTMKGEGEGKIEGTLDQDGEKIQLDGTFTLSIEAEQVYE
ncbi:MAG TPA: hypothetical protein VF950_23850 [Planctomycetota bacterium]